MKVILKNSALVFATRKSVNLLPPSCIEDGRNTYIGEDGAMQPINDRDAILWIPVEEGKTYKFTTDRSTSDTTRIINAFGASYLYSDKSTDGSTFVRSTGYDAPFTIQPGERWLCVGGFFVRNNLELRPMLVLDEVPNDTPYEEYGA